MAITALMSVQASISKAGVQHVRNSAARRFDLHGQIAHIIRQAEVKVDLAQNKCNAQQRHDPLFRLHLFE